MPNHRCGFNAYQGQTDTQLAAGGGLLAMFFAAASAFTRTTAEVQQAYDRNCPSSCNTKKSGIVAYQLASFRAVTVGKFEVPSLPAGKQFPGYQIVIRWRLIVICDKAEKRDVEAAPTVMSWDEVEKLLKDCYGDKYEKELKPVH